MCNVKCDAWNDEWGANTSAVTYSGTFKLQSFPHN